VVTGELRCNLEVETQRPSPLRSDSGREEGASLPVELGSVVAIQTAGSVPGWFSVSYV